MPENTDLAELMKKPEIKRYLDEIALIHMEILSDAGVPYDAVDEEPEVRREEPSEQTEE